MGKINFSFALIARNEEKTLPRLLKSLNEFKERGGKVYLCDTGSTDNTAQVARDWGCMVYEVGNKFLKITTEEQANIINSQFIVDNELEIIKIGDTLFDFSSARNYIAEKSHTDWVWQVDCDEELTKFDIDSIEEAIKDKNISRLVYEFVFSHDQDGNPAIRFTHSKFYNKRNLEWRGLVHEVLQPMDKYGGEKYISQDKILLEHFQNHSTDRSQYLRGLAYAAAGFSSSAESEDRASHYFARELFFTGRYRSAIKEFKNHISMDKWPAERSQSMIYIGDCLLALGEDNEALDWYHKAFLLESGRREPLIRLAEYFYKKSDYQKVVCYIAAALEIPETGFYANNHAHYAQLPHELMYVSQWYLGNKEASRGNWKKCLEYQPNNPKYIHDKQFYE